MISVIKTRPACPDRCGWTALIPDGWSSTTLLFLASSANFKNTPGNRSAGTSKMFMGRKITVPPIYWGTFWPHRVRPDRPPRPPRQLPDNGLVPLKHSGLDPPLPAVVNSRRNKLMGSGPVIPVISRGVRTGLSYRFISVSMGKFIIWSS